MSLRAFSNEIQFSCKNPTNQISQNSRLNWFTLPNECPQWNGEWEVIHWNGGNLYRSHPTGCSLYARTRVYLKGDDLR